MGKSTAAQSFALNCIEPAASADATKPALIPVFLRLRAHSDEIGKIGLEQLLMNQISRIGSIDAQQSEYLLEDWIKTSRLFIILDGLDEISSESARRLSDQLRVFGNSAKGLSCRILLTSRRTGYAGVDHAFTEYEIQPLEDRAAAIEFVIGWLSAIRSYSREQAQTDAEQLVSSIDARSGFRSICTDPLLLYLAVRIYESTGHMEAGNRAELLALYVKTLYEKHDKPSEIVAVKIPLDQVMYIMALAAWVLHTYQPQGPLTIAQIVSAIRDSAQGAENVSEALSLAHKTLGLLQKSSVTKVTPEVDFSHAHFRDYFVALRLKLAWEADSDRTKKLIKPLLHATAFQEPLLMLAAMLPDETANQFIQFVADADSDFKFELSRDLLLAAEMLTVRPYKETDFSRWVVRRTVYRYLLHITILPPDGANLRKIQERIETLLHDLGEPARVSIVDFVMQDAQAKPAKQKRDWWRKSAIIAIGKLKIEGPAVSALLLEAMTEDYSIAQAAMFALGEVGPASDEIIFALLNASGRPGWDRPTWVTQHAVEALYRIGERNPDLVKKLKELLLAGDERLLFDKSYQVVAASLFRLAQTSRDAMYFVLQCTVEIDKEGRFPPASQSKNRIIDQLTLKAKATIQGFFNIHDYDEDDLRKFKWVSTSVLRHLLSVIKRSNDKFERWTAYQFLRMVMSDETSTIECREMDHGHSITVALDLVPHFLSTLRYRLPRESGNSYDDLSEILVSRLTRWGLSNPALIEKLIKFVRKEQHLFFTTFGSEQYADKKVRITEFRRHYELLLHSESYYWSPEKFEARRLKFLDCLCSSAAGHISSRVGKCEDVSIDPKIVAALLSLAGLGYFSKYFWQTITESRGWKELRKECSLRVTRALTLLNGEANAALDILTRVAYGKREAFMVSKLELYFQETERILQSRFPNRVDDDQRVAAAAGLARLASTIPKAKQQLLALVNLNDLRTQHGDERDARSLMFNALGYVDFADSSIIEILLAETEDPKNGQSSGGYHIGRLKSVDEAAAPRLIQSFIFLSQLTKTEVRSDKLRSLVPFVAHKVKFFLRRRTNHGGWGPWFGFGDYKARNVLKALGKVHPSNPQIEEAILEACQHPSYSIWTDAVEQLGMLPSPSIRVIKALYGMMWHKSGAADALAQAITHLSVPEFASHVDALSDMARKMTRNTRVNERKAMKHLSRSWFETTFEPLSNLVSRLTQVDALKATQNLELPPLEKPKR